MGKGLGNCPTCNVFRSVCLTGNRLHCNECSFELFILCPLCNVGQLSIGTNEDLNCAHCQFSVKQHVINYIVENKLKIDEGDQCEFCNSPMVSRKDMNINSRCFFHPTCGNQQSLFEEPDIKEYVFLDFETTGLDIGNESIIEFGACKVDKTGKEYFFQELVKPVNSVSPLITKITGITQDMVKDSPSLNHVLSSFVDFCGDAPIVAHNAQFDVPWLLTSLLRHQLPINFTDICCTLMWAKTRESGKRSLGALSKKYNIGHESAHRAMADAVVTKELFYIYEKDSKEIPIESIDRYMDISKKLVAKYPDFHQA